MPDHYDVIVIGTGAGGGTLAHTLAAVRQADPAAGTRQLPAPRDRRTGSPRRCSSRAGTSRPTPGTTRTAQPFQPQVHYFVGGATKLYGAALYRLRPQDFGEIEHADGISPAWPVSYDDFEPWYTKAEWLYQVHGTHGEDPTEGAWSKQYPWPAVSHEPRIQEIADTWRPPATTRSRRRAASCSTRPTGPRSTCIRCTWCDGYPCLVHAKSDAETIAVRPLLMAPNVTLLVEAEVVKLETDASGRTVTGVVVVARRRAGGLRGRHRRRLGRRVEQRQAAAAVGQRPPPERAGQRLRPGRPQLHVPQLQGGGRAGQGAQRHGVPEDPRAQRLLLRRHATTAGRSATSRWSASPTAGR